jgi:hypothetical protein
VTTTIGVFSPDALRAMETIEWGANLVLAIALFAVIAILVEEAIWGWKGRKDS